VVAIALQSEATTRSHPRQRGFARHPVGQAKTPENQFTDLFNKSFIVLRDGSGIKVLTGSTNLSLYRSWPGKATWSRSPTTSASTTAFGPPSALRSVWRSARSGLSVLLNIENDARGRRSLERARNAHGHRRPVDCEGHQRSQKCFPNPISFRHVDAEIEITFSKKGENFQESQGILSPLRLPVPPRPLWLQNQIFNAFFELLE
jgi:hypothetical protein